jgi:hypothetical protein
MALQGNYNFKGIEISEAYLQVGRINCFIDFSPNQKLKTEAVYNSDGSLQSEAVYETEWLKAANSSCSVRIYKDKESRDSDPNGQIADFDYQFNSSLAATAKNHVKQAYEALKTNDKYKDYTDV